MKTLIYCGTNNGEGLHGLLASEPWDRVYGFEANPHLYSKLKHQHANDPRIKMYNTILSDRHNVETEFYILDANNTEMNHSSSVCKLEDFNPKYKKISGNEIELRETVRLKTTNLCTFLQEEGIEEIECLLTDLEGSDLTVLKTVKPFIDKKQIKNIQCEVEPDHMPVKYKGLDNKLRGFKEMLDENYNLIWSDNVPTHYFQVDYKWALKDV